jgi:hypothetical protein
MDIDRRDSMKLAGVGGIVFASGSGGRILGAMRQKQEEFNFVQLSDTHMSEPSATGSASSQYQASENGCRGE